MANPAMNKAKCLTCGDILVSKHLHDHAMCSCGNVSVCGGTVNPVIRATDYMKLGSVEEGADVVQAKEKSQKEEQGDETHEKFSKIELIEILEAMAKSIDRLPIHANLAPVTQRDLYELLLVLSSIFRAS